jgi:putative effector of murein hydrolase LrgA (UPF0299 family)
MIATLSLILLCQLAGEVIAGGLGLPMPGPVLGLVLLLLLLLARDRSAVLARGPLQQDGMESASRGLLANLSLLFVPAGVGVVQKLDLVAAHGIAVAVRLPGCPKENGPSSALVAIWGRRTARGRPATSGS